MFKATDDWVSRAHEALTRHKNREKQRNTKKPSAEVSRHLQVTGILTVHTVVLPWAQGKLGKVAKTEGELEDHHSTLTMKVNSDIRVS